MKTKHLLYMLWFTTGILFSCKEQAGQAEAKATEDPGVVVLSKRQFEANDMAVGSVSEMEFPEVIQVSGTIDVPPENRVIISAVYGGFVKKTPLLIGDQVRKGETVAVLENPEFLSLQQEYMEVSEQLPYLKSEFERQKTLFEEQISSEKLFLQSQSTYRSTLARKNGLEKQLSLLGLQPEKITPDNMRSDIALRAPISGKVTQVNISTGSYASRASEMLEIINPDHLHLELSVFEQDIGKVREGQSIRFRIPEVSDTEYQGRVYLVGSSIDANRTVKVHGHLDEESKTALLVGMFVQADIMVTSGQPTDKDTPTYMALPEEAIGRGASGPFVLVQEQSSETGYRFRKVAVKTGATTRGITAITDPGNLNKSDLVLLKGTFLISDME